MGLGGKATETGGGGIDGGETAPVLGWFGEYICQGASPACGPSGNMGLRLAAAYMDDHAGDPGYINGFIVPNGLAAGTNNGDVGSLVALSSGNKPLRRLE